MSDLGFEVRIDLAKFSQRDLVRLSKQLDSVLSNRKVKFDVDNSAQRSLAKIDKGLKKVNTAAKQATHSMQSFGKEAAFAVRRFGAFTVAVGFFRNFSGSVKTAIKDAFAFERELVKIGQVSNKTLSQLVPLRAEVLRLASSYGVSSQKILESARVLTQAGISATAVKKSLDALAKTELAPTFGDMTQTTEAAIAIFRQFGTGAEKLEGQLDSINSVASKFAVESNDIVQVIRKAGGIFKSTGGSLEELIALFTTVRSTTRESADSIATGLRTIFVRLQRPELINQLEKLGITLRDSNNLFVGPFQALEAISQKLSKLDPQSETVAKITEALGGFRQVSRVIPLIQNFGEANKALNVALTSQGSLLNDVSQAQESVIVKYEQLRQKFFKLVSDIQSDDTFKGLALDLIKVGKAVVDVADSIRPLVPLITTIAALKLTIGGVGFARGFVSQTKNFTIPRNNGGLIPGRGPNKDSVLTYLTKGEFVLQRDAVDAIGVNKLEALNNVKKANTGGLIGAQSLNNGGGVGRVSAGLFAGSVIVQVLSNLKKESDNTAESVKTFGDSLASSAAFLSSMLFGIGALIPALNILKEKLNIKVKAQGLTSSVFPSLNSRRGQVVGELKKARRLEKSADVFDSKAKESLDKQLLARKRLVENKSERDFVASQTSGLNQQIRIKKGGFLDLNERANKAKNQSILAKNRSSVERLKLRNVSVKQSRITEKFQDPTLTEAQKNTLTDEFIELDSQKKEINESISKLNKVARDKVKEFDKLTEKIQNQKAQIGKLQSEKSERLKHGRLLQRESQSLSRDDIKFGKEADVNLKKSRAKRVLAGKRRGKLGKVFGGLQRVSGRGAKIGKFASKIGRAGAKLATSGVGGAVVSLLAEPVLGLVGEALGGTEGGKFAKKNFGGALSGAGTGAAIGSIIPGVGTFIGGAIGGLIGSLPALAKNFDAVNAVLKYVPFGLTDFTTGLQDAAKETSSKKISTASKELEKDLKNLNKTKVGASVKEQGKLNQESVKKLFQTSLNVIKAKKSIATSGVASRDIKGLVELSNKDIKTFSPKIIEEFDKLAQANPSENLIKLASRIGNSSDVLKVLDAALQSAGIELEDYAKQIKNSNKEFSKINKAQVNYLAELSLRTQVGSALQGASFARDSSVNAIKGATGNFTQNDLTGLFDRAARGDIQRRDVVSSRAFGGALADIAAFGGVARPVASLAETEAIAAQALPNILNRNSINRKGGADRIFGQLSNLVGKRVGGKKLVSDIKDAFDKAFTGDQGSIKLASGQEIESFINNTKGQFTKNIQALKDFQVALQEQNGKLQEAYNTRLSIENQLNDRISSGRQAQFNAANNILKFGRGRGISVSEAGLRDRIKLNDALRGTGLGGNASLSDLQAKLRSSTIKREQARQNQDVASFNKFNQEINSVTRALELMRDSSEKASAIQDRLNSLQERQAGGRGLIEKFLTGSKEDRKSLQKDINNAQILLGGGTLSGKDLKGGLDTVRTLQGDEVANKILARLAGPQGAEFFKPIGKTVQGKPLFNQLQQINQNQAVAGGVLVNDSKQTLATIDNFITQLSKRFDETLRSLLKRPGELNGQQASNTVSTINGELTHNFNINLNGAEVMKGIEPSIQAIVVATTNKIVTESLRANGINAPAEVQLGTAGKV